MSEPNGSVLSDVKQKPNHQIRSDLKNFILFNPNHLNFTDNPVDSLDTIFTGWERLHSYEPEPMNLAKRNRIEKTEHISHKYFNVYMYEGFLPGIEHKIIFACHLNPYGITTKKYETKNINNINISFRNTVTLWKHLHFSARINMLVEMMTYAFIVDIPTNIFTSIESLNSWDVRKKVWQPHLLALFKAAHRNLEPDMYQKMLAVYLLQTSD